MKILGINTFFHDSSATLVVDGKVICAAEEERFTRKKHDNSFPTNSIKFCLEFANLDPKDIDYVAVGEKPMLKFERVLRTHIENYPRSIKTFLQGIPSWFNERLRIGKFLKKVSIDAPIFYIDHHMAHAASAFLASQYEKAAIVTIDGVGEWSTTTIGIGDKSKITLEKQIKFPHSLGLLYSTITAYLGFSVNNAEYKVMGLSAYGEKDKNKNIYYKKLCEVIDIKDDGSFQLNMSFFRYTYSDRMPSSKLEALLGGRTRKKGLKLENRHRDIAAALQIITEEVVLKIINEAQRITGLDKLVMAGGVALNSVLNGKILKNSSFKELWIQPNASDGGTGMGAALFVSNCLLGENRAYLMKNAFLGPDFSSKYIKTYLDANSIKYSEFKDDRELITITARLLANKKVIGWFQGRMEWGPRALGARSILGSPLDAKMKDIINLKVKKREPFRPFAPVVAYDDADKYFETDEKISDSADFMLLVYPIKEVFYDKIPAVRHVDGSGRLQTIKREQMPLYYDVVKEFGKITGVSVLINTSFNIRSEPIVCSPEDAYRCMMGTEIDYLVIDRFLIRREENLQDKWNSAVNNTD